MSGFAEIISFISEIVKFVFERSIDLIAIVCLVASCGLPWRLMENIHDFRSSYRNEEDFHCFCFSSLVLTIIDFFAVPALLVGLLCPFLWEIVPKTFSSDNPSSNRYKLRENFFALLGGSLFTYFSCFMGLFVILSPFGRQFMLYSLWSSPSSSRVIRRPDFEDHYDDIMDKFLTLGLLGTSSLLDFFFLPTVLFSIIMPSLWRGTIYKGFVYLRDSLPPDNTSRTLRDDWYEWYHSLRMELLMQVPHALIDLVTAPFAIMAFVSPLRHSVYLNSLKDKIAELQLKIDQRKVSQFENFFSHNYNIELRYEAFRMAFLGLADFFILPMLLPIFLFRYRYPSVRSRFSFEKILGVQEIFFIAVQSFLQCLDLLILFPVVPILWVTQIRWAPLSELLQKENVFLDNSASVYAMAVTQLGCLLMDIIVSPMALIILLSYYRSKPLIEIWRNPSVWHNEPSTFHVMVLGNLLIIIHDICLLTPITLVTCLLCPYRINLIYDTIVGSFPISSRGADIVSRNSNPDIYRPNSSFTGEDLNKSASSRSEANELVQESKSMDHDHTIEIYPTSVVRGVLWEQFFYVFLDFPFIVLSFIVFFSLWRAAELWADIRRVWNLHDNRLSTLIYKRGEDTIRCAIITQLCLLFRDIIFLVPFSIVVGTIYRLPSFAIESLAKFSSGSLGGKTLFQIVTCNVESPEVGGPLLNLKLRVSEGNEDTDFQLQRDDAVELHVIGADFWESISTTFGSTLASVGRSLLPLKLKDGKGVGLGDFMNSLDAQKNGLTLNSDCWVRIVDLGKTKRSSVIKKLRLLQPSSKITLQFESFVLIKQSRKKVVLFRMSTSVSQLISTIESGSALITEESLNLPQDLAIDAVAARQSNFVNSFYILVAKNLGEILLDLFFLVQFLLTAISPWRFFSLIKTLLEQESFLPLRISEHAVDSILHADYHILEYRSGICEMLNASQKKMLTTFLELQAASYYIGGNKVASFQEDIIQVASLELEADHLKPYQNLTGKVVKSLSQFEGCEHVLSLVTERENLYDDILRLWFTRLSSSTSLAQINSGRRALVRIILSEQHDDTGRKLVKNKLLLKQELAKMKLHCQDKAKHASLRNCGLFTRSLKETRSLIALSCQQAVVDIFFFMLLSAIFLTVFRAIPLVKDLYRYNSFSPYRYSTRFIVRKHALNAVSDIYYAGKFMLFTSLILGTVVGAPAFFVKLPRNLSSLREAANFAADHFSYIIWYCCELFLFIFACRTYRLVIRASLYGFLVPAACLAEAQPFISTGGVIGKVFIGLLIWVGLLAGSIRTAQLGFLAANTAATSAATLVNSSLLILAGCIFGIFIMAACTTSTKKVYTIPSASAIRAPDISWSHILALFTGPLESMQLSAVVMYFFWNNNAFGVDSFSSRVMMWGVHGGDYIGYSKSTSLASVFILIWGILVAIPIAASGGEQKKRLKVMAFKNSPLYDLVIVFISRLFTVWIMATLMRSSSCFNISGSDGAPSNVLTTSIETTCGGGGSWAALGSLPLLTYFVVTSSILHADDADLLNNPNDGEIHESTVKFSPLYALLVRAGQLFVCAICFGGFWAPKSSSILIPIMILASVMTLVPAAFSRNVCSVAAMTPLRSAGWLSVSWTALVCLLKAEGLSSAQSELMIYIGWIVIFALASLMALYLDHLDNTRWLKKLQNSGLQETIATLIGACETLIVNEAMLTGGSVNKQEVAAARLAKYQRDMSTARSSIQLARILLSIERLILLDRLSHEFIVARNAWVFNLEKLVNNPFADSSTELVQTNYRGNRTDIENTLRSSEDSRAPSNREIDNQSNNISMSPINVDDDDSILAKAVAASIEDENKRQAKSHEINVSGSSSAPASVEEMLDVHKDSQRSLKLIGDSARRLSAGIAPVPLIVNVSKEVVTILLSRRLPTEVCWVIFDYCLTSNSIRNILDLPPATFRLMYDPESLTTTSYRSDITDREFMSKPSLSKFSARFFGDSYTNQMHDYAESYFEKRKSLLSTVQL